MCEWTDWKCSSWALTQSSQSQRSHPLMSSVSRQLKGKQSTNSWRQLQSIISIYRLFTIMFIVISFPSDDFQNKTSFIWKTDSVCLQRFRNKIWICLFKWFLCLGLIRTCSSQQPETFIMFTSSRVLPAHTHTPVGIGTNTPGWCHLKVSRRRRRWRDQQSSRVRW